LKIFAITNINLMIFEHRKAGVKLRHYAHGRRPGNFFGAWTQSDDFFDWKSGRLPGAYSLTGSFLGVFLLGSVNVSIQLRKL